MTLKLRIVLGISSLFIGAQALADCPAQFAPLGRPVALQVLSRHGKRVFNVEVARTPQQQERGLMCRSTLAANNGMIFPMRYAHTVAFWMKDTMIPLDIIFIKPDGRIESVRENARPYDLTPLASGGSVSAVLEIAGGQAAKQHIRAGDKVIWTAR